MITPGVGLKTTVSPGPENGVPFGPVVDPSPGPYPNPGSLTTTPVTDPPVIIGVRDAPLPPGLPPTKMDG